MCIDDSSAQLITRAPQESPSQKMLATFARQKEVMVPGVPCVDRGNWGRELALSAVFCEEFSSNNRTLFDDVAYKDFDRFRKGSVHEL